MVVNLPDLNFGLLLRYFLLHLEFEVFQNAAISIRQTGCALGAIPVHNSAIEAYMLLRRLVTRNLMLLIWLRILALVIPPYLETFW